MRGEDSGRSGTACRALVRREGVGATLVVALGCGGRVFGWLLLLRSGDKPGFGPAAELLFFASPKKSNQKKGEPRPCRFAVPCATRSVRDTCKLASLELSTPLNRLRRFPLQGTTPAARQSRLRGVPGRGCASRTSPRLLVRCAHLAGVGLPHSSRLTSLKARHAVPLRQTPSFLTPHLSSWATTRVAPTPSLLLTPPTTSLLTPTTSLTHSSPSLTPHPHSPLTPHSSLLTPHSKPSS